MTNDKAADERACVLALGLADLCSAAYLGRVAVGRRAASARGRRRRLHSGERVTTSR